MLIGLITDKNVEKTIEANKNSINGISLYFIFKNKRKLQRDGSGGFNIIQK